MIKFIGNIFSPKFGRLTEDVADTIAKQIGNKALYMMGAKNLVKDSKSLSFQIGRNPKGITHIKITYNYGGDSYDIEFGKLRGTNYNVVKTVKDVFVDSLHNVLADTTNLRLSL